MEKLVAQRRMSEGILCLQSKLVTQEVQPLALSVRWLAPPFCHRRAERLFDLPFDGCAYDLIADSNESKHIVLAWVTTLWR